MWFFLGVFATVATFGIIGCVVFYESTSRYIKLDHDYVLSDGSILKSGTELKVDDNQPENCSRYILYVNSKGRIGNSQIHEKPNLKIPYWVVLPLNPPINTSQSQ